MNKKDIIILIILGILLLLPLLTTDNYYPLEVGDFKNDVARAEQAKIGGNVHDFSNHYMGRTIMAYIVGYISRITDASCKNIQLGINYTIILGALVTVYLVTSRMFGIVAGTLSASLMIFCTHGIAQLFHAGDIWNIIEICIILIPALYFLSRWITLYRKKYLIIALVLFALFSSVHNLALTLPYTLGIFFACFLTYKLAKKEYKGTISLCLLFIGIVIGNLTLSYVFIPDAIGLHLAAVTGTIPAGIANNPIIYYGERIPVSLPALLLIYITIPIIGILTVSLVALRKIKSRIKLSQEHKWFRRAA